LATEVAACGAIKFAPEQIRSMMYGFDLDHGAMQQTFYCASLSRNSGL
jgi:hypothetical protein